MLNITYKSKALMKVCTDYSEAVGKHGEKMARKIHQRTNELEAADSLETLVKFSIGRLVSIQVRKFHQSPKGQLKQLGYGPLQFGEGL